MPDKKDVSLARFLDALAASLANDLDWALDRLDEMKNLTPVNKVHAERYVRARAHLKTRRRYEEACSRDEQKAGEADGR